MSLKIIALEVLDSCDSIHSKNLIKNIPYVFYKNYKIKKNNDNETIQLVSEDFDLYSKDSETKINISAIVGKNGSGKSTLVELLIKGINNFFYVYKEQNPIKEFHITDKIDGVSINLFYKINKDIFKIKVCQNQFNKIEYEIYKGEWNANIKEWFIPKSKEPYFENMDSFFYTEIINYSLYAYNSNLEGSWINHIFHKNDAYQTPIVLNPWRKEGNIDINTENKLIYQRLIANLVRFDTNNQLNLSLGDNLKANQLILQLSEVDYYQNKSIENFDVDLSIFSHDMRREILKLLLKKFHNTTPDKTIIENDILERVEIYLLYKMISICHKYNEYSYDKYYDFTNNRFNNLKGLISTLYNDNSHITFKLRQTLNYLVYQHIEFDISKTTNKLSLKNIANEIKKVAEIEKCNIINCLPPPIFKTDINLDSLKSTGKKIKFSTLSSGEKQQIYSTSSIYYHLMNLDSVKMSTDNEKIHYKYINVILEEIELYFHPDYQRTFIDKLLQGIKKLNLANIKGINLIFVTHSPFILSDIPNSNVMYLKTNNKGESVNIEDKKTTFASNIHHLLGDSFFFENKTYLGEFARNEIKKVINYIKDSKENDKIENVEYYYNLIELIDEPILKNKLIEMLFEKFPHFQKQKNIDKKEMLVKAFAEQMGIKINIKNN
ncbi:hypothetical protein [Myroides odoratimimus]|uniref:hypothetical protein n=1 Tax=Myroides odoratimimus TaxID=76832 RepID=UPI003100A9DC